MHTYVKLTFNDVDIDLRYWFEIHASDHANTVDVLTRFSLKKKKANFNNNNEMWTFYWTTWRPYLTSDNWYVMTFWYCITSDEKRKGNPTSHKGHLFSMFLFSEDNRIEWVRIWMEFTRRSCNSKRNQCNAINVYGYFHFNSLCMYVRIPTYLTKLIYFLRFSHICNMFNVEHGSRNNKAKWN